MEKQMPALFQDWKEKDSEPKKGSREEEFRLKKKEKGNCEMK